MQDLDELILSLEKAGYLGMLDELDRRFPEEKHGRFLYTDELIRKLTDILENRDADTSFNKCSGAAALLMIAEADGLDTRYADIFGRYLKDCVSFVDYESIIKLLGEIKDPRSVDVLFETALDIHESDDARGQAKKCMYSLAQIGTDAALEKLQILERSDDEIISEFATFVISRVFRR